MVALGLTTLPDEMVPVAVGGDFAGLAVRLAGLADDLGQRKHDDQWRTRLDDEVTAIRAVNEAAAAVAADPDADAG